MRVGVGRVAGWISQTPTSMATSLGYSVRLLAKVETAQALDIPRDVRELVAQFEGLVRHFSMVAPGKKEIASEMGNFLASLQGAARDAKSVKDFVADAEMLIGFYKGVRYEKIESGLFSSLYQRVTPNPLDFRLTSWGFGGKL